MQCSHVALFTIRGRSNWSNQLTHLFGYIALLGCSCGADLLAGNGTLNRKNRFLQDLTRQKKRVSAALNLKSSYILFPQRGFRR